jgi:hypothetical protein
MSKKTKLIIIAAIFLLVVVFLTEVAVKGKVAINTDKLSYHSGDYLKVDIRNLSVLLSCFSSCYPFYIENSQNGKDWKRMNYGECADQDIAEKCLSSGKRVKFELNLPSILESGYYRLALPVCNSCTGSNLFKAERWFYSNEFKIE